MGVTTQPKRFITKKAYDRITVLVRHDFKDTIERHAEERGESVNAFVRRALYATMEQDNNK